MICVIIPNSEVPITLVEELVEEENGSRTQVKKYCKDQDAIKIRLL